MTCSSRTLALVCVLFGALSSPLLSQIKVAVVGAAYESSDLLTPNVVLVIPHRASDTSGLSGLTWNFALLGPTFTAEGIKEFSPRFALVFGTDLTPFKANGSSRVYRDGREAPDLEFTDRSFQARVGVRLQPSKHWRTDLQLSGLKESVGGLSDVHVLNYWNRPYAGFGIAQEYGRVVSDEVFQSRFEGIKIASSGETFFGPNTWWRVRLNAAGGKRLGKVFLRGQAAAFDGGGLNVVSRFLVGGSWDTEQGLPLYGFRYAQFRIDRGVVLNGGGDLRLKGNWEAGVRSSFLDSPGKRAHGTALKIGSIWNGIGLHVGVGIPGRASNESRRGGAFVFADAEFASAWR